MLTMDDFEILESSWVKPCVVGSAFVESKELQRRLALMCIESVKLCIPLGRILETLNSPKGVYRDHDAPVSIRGRMMLLASDSDVESVGSHQEHESLVKWAENLADAVIYQRPSGDIDETLTVHSALLQMVYFATIISATKKIAATHLTHSGGPETIYIAVEKTRLAALEITKVMQDLQELDLIRYLPTSGVTPVMMASIAHLQFATEGRKSIRQSSASAFYQCIEAMHLLRDSYFSADFAYALMIKEAGRIGPRDVDWPSIRSCEKDQNSGAAGITISDTRYCPENTTSITTKALHSYMTPERTFPSLGLAQSNTSPSSSNQFHDIQDVQLEGFEPSDRLFENLSEEESFNTLFGWGSYPMSWIQL